MAYCGGWGLGWHAAVAKQRSYCSDISIKVKMRVFFCNDLLPALNGPNRGDIMHCFMANQIPTELKSGRATLAVAT